MAAWGDGDDEDDLFSGFDVGTSKTKKGPTAYRDAIIFLIDTSRPMFTPMMNPEDANSTTTPFQFALRVASESNSNKIIQKEHDFLGVILFGTSTSANPQQFPHITIFQGLDLPSAARISQFDDFLELKPDDLLSTVESSFGIQPGPDELGADGEGGCQFHQVLWCAQTMFDTIGSGSSSILFRRMMCFSNRSDPCGGSEDRSKVIPKLRDMLDGSIDLDLFLLGDGSAGSPDGAGDDVGGISRFWRTVSDVGASLRQIEELTGDIINRMKKKVFRKRVLTTIPWQITDDTTIGVQVYNAIMPARVSASAKLQEGTNALLASESKMQCVETAQDILNPVEDVIMGYNYGGERVSFSVDEFKKIRFLRDVLPEGSGLRLIGFKERKYLKFWHNIKPSGFLYPTDSNFSGSARGFAALHQKMREQKMIALCRYKFRTESQILYVALLPYPEGTGIGIVEGDEEIEEEGEESLVGFQMVYLPFSENIRDVEFREMPEISEEDIDVSTRLVKSLTYPGFDSTDIENPVIQRHYAVLQALALNRPLPIVVDATLPDITGMSKHSDVLNGFRDHFYGDDAVVVKKKAKAETGRKRGRQPKREPDADDDGPPRKRQRLTPRASRAAETSSDSDDDDAPIDVVALAKAGNLTSLTVPELKSFLRMYKLRVGGNKGTLIDRIRGFLQERGKL